MTLFELADAGNKIVTSIGAVAILVTLLKSKDGEAE